MTATVAATVQSTAEKIAAYRGRVTDTQLDAMVLGASLAIWSSDESVKPWEVEDAIRAAIA